MTVEELKERMDKDLDEVFNVKSIIDFHFDFLQKTYTKGLETGMKVAGPQWHKVAAGDLPKPNIAVLICLQFEKRTTTYIAYYRPAINKWQMYNMHEAQRQPIVEDYIDSDEVIAWCEIPKYTEED